MKKKFEHQRIQNETKSIGVRCLRESEFLWESWIIEAKTTGIMNDIKIQMILLLPPTMSTLAPGFRYTVRRT